MTEGIQIPIPGRMKLVRAVVTFSFLCCIALTWRLWSGERSFPHAPVIGGFCFAPFAENALLISAVLLLVGSLVLRWERVFTCLALICILLLVAADINRMQPWVAVFAGILMLFVFYSGRVDDANVFGSYFILLQLLIAAVYIFTGIYQMNRVSPDDTAALLAPLHAFLSERQFAIIMRLSAALPWLLLFIAFSLIVSPMRYLGITAAVIMHVALLILLWPSAVQTNYALWLSNGVFILLVMLLYSGNIEHHYYSPLHVFRLPALYLVTFIYICTPAYMVWQERTDMPVFSFHFKRDAGMVRVDDAQYRSLPLYQRAFCTNGNGDRYLNLSAWFRHELNAECMKPVVPAEETSFAVKEDEFEDMSGTSLLRVNTGNSIFAEN